MSTRALVVLEDLRRDEVEHAGRELALQRDRHGQACAAEQAAAGAEVVALHELATARQDFASARTVFALRAAEAVLCVANNALARAQNHREQSRLGLREAERVLACGEARLRSLEVARRTVARTLEQRAADVSLRLERRLEEESDEAFRVQSHRSAGLWGAPSAESRPRVEGSLTAPAHGPRGRARTGSH